MGLFPEPNLFHRRAWAGQCLSIGLGASLVSISSTRAEQCGTIQKISLCVDQRERSCLFYQPAACNHGSHWPLLMAFHGYLQPNRRFERYAELKSAADRHGFLLALPQGEGWAMFRSFNAGMRDDANDPDDARFIAALLGELHQFAPIDPSRIYAIGMSNGAMFTHTLAQQLPGVLAGFVAVSGTSAMPINPATPPTPMMLVHGTHDPIAPWTGPTPRTPRFIKFQDVDSTINQWRGVNGSATVNSELSVYDLPGNETCVVRHLWPAPPGIVETVLLQVENGGHRWPALSPKHYFPLTGTQSTDISLNDVAWEFLSRQRRDVVIEK